MNKITLNIILVLFFISCSSDDFIEHEETLENNKLEIRYRGYYQVFFDEPYVRDTYTNIVVTSITEQISSIETIDLYKINAFSDNDNQDYISFKVLKNSIGNNILYNDQFTFRSYGATYLPSNLNFNVLANNDEEFTANFSGELEHWYDGEQRYVYLDISSASITFKH